MVEKLKHTIFFKKHKKRSTLRLYFMVPILGMIIRHRGSGISIIWKSMTKKDSEDYQKTQENMEQGKYYYDHSADPVYRENKWQRIS